jgi:hypothetical protein
LSNLNVSSCTSCPNWASCAGVMSLCSAMAYPPRRFLGAFSGNDEKSVLDANSRHTF